MPKLTTLVSFSGPAPGNGIYDSAAVIADPAGDLFGTTAGGGRNGGYPGDGTVYEVPYADGTYASTPTELVNFNGADGEDPQDSLIINADGDLFGTTQTGGANGEGTVFEIPRTAGSYASTPTTLATFNNTNGETPVAGLFADAAGDLFGTTYYGGANGDGTVFEIVKTGTGYATTPTTLVTFNGANGVSPDCILLPDAAGDLFGTTVLGGANGDGTVFELAKTGSSYASTPTTLVSFNGLDGTEPIAGLIADAAGDLFGTAYSGGPGGDGTVFEIPYSNGSYASTPITLVSFNGADGANPHASLIIDAAGDLFGTTSGVSIGLAGTVFEVAKTDGGYAATPTRLANVSYPVGSLIANAVGDLFSTTAVGGASGAGMVFELSDTGFVVCYLAGTQIATQAGELPVERLTVGDMAMTLRGEARRIVWIGEGRGLATRGRRNAATPVIVRKGALADNVPHHDLHVTKGHSLYIDDVLIPVEFLVNHRSILWDDRAQEISIYHIELETHDVLLANGAPAESYRDDGNRWLFRNANSGWGLSPQAPCAPVHTGGPVVDAVWRRLLQRAGPRPGVPLTDDPDLHVVVDGHRLDAAQRVGSAYVFRLPVVPSALRIVSRAAAPAELGLARDPRVLGIALRRLVVRKATRFRITEAIDDRLADGFHAFEADNGFRWTDGDAAVPVALFAGFTGSTELVLDIGATARYLAADAVQHAA